jgi:hypothetical protein
MKPQLKPNISSAQAQQSGSSNPAVTATATNTVNKRDRIIATRRDR